MSGLERKGLTVLSRSLHYKTVHMCTVISIQLYFQAFKLLKLIHRIDTFISNMGNSDASCTL